MSCYMKYFRVGDIMKDGGENERWRGGLTFNQMWWSFLERVDVGSPRIREVCWWVVRVV